MGVTATLDALVPCDLFIFAIKPDYHAGRSQARHREPSTTTGLLRGLAAQRLIALAGQFFQLRQIDNLDDTTGITDDRRVLHLDRNFRD
jgi:hypothetical protein